MSVRQWFRPAVMREYAHSARVRIDRARHGHTRMPGNAAQIIRAGIERCWNGASFTASPGHFNMFWTRDLCFSSTSLVALGETDRLVRSLDWAMATWQRRHSHITTTIHHGASPSDVYDYGVDSLPLLLAALNAAGSAGDELVERYGSWLDSELRHFVRTVVDPQTGLVRSDRKFSAHRDTVTNRSNAYGNAMVALAAKVIHDRPEWHLPALVGPFFPDADFGALLRRHFWDDDHYRDALGEERSSGEANLWPFWTGVERDPEMLRAAFGYLRREGYTDPLPLRYETVRRPELEVWATRHLLPDYQGSTVWTSIGAMYISLLRTVDAAAARDLTRRYADLTERDGTFWEVLDATTQQCWVSPRWILIGEESMLWGALFGALLERPELAPLVLSQKTGAANG